MEGILNLDFGFSPSNINSGGNGLITKSNVQLLSDPAFKGIRY